MDKSTNESPQHQVSETFTEQFRQAVADHVAERNTLGGLFVTYLVGNTGDAAGNRVDDIIGEAINSLSLTMQVAVTANYESTPNLGMENVIGQCSRRLEAVGEIVRHLLVENLEGAK
jgi:hypothetical protein